MIKNIGVHSRSFAFIRSSFVVDSWLIRLLGKLNFFKVPMRRKTSGGDITLGCPLPAGRLWIPCHFRWEADYPGFRFQEKAPPPGL
jgi:hypothetical protein